MQSRRTAATDDAGESAGRSMIATRKRTKALRWNINPRSDSPLNSTTSTGDSRSATMGGNDEQSIIGVRTDIGEKHGSDRPVQARPLTTYKATNWSACNDALKRRGSLTIWFDPEMTWRAPPTGKGGGQPGFSDAALRDGLACRSGKGRGSCNACYSLPARPGWCRTSVPCVAANEC